MPIIRPPSPERSKVQWVLYGVIAAAVAAAVILAVAYILHQRALPGRIAKHIASGDRYREEIWYDRALKEYEAALALAPTHLQAKRRIVTAMREGLTLKGFGPGSQVDPALRAGYPQLELLATTEVQAALAHVRDLYAQAPDLKQDPATLWDEALILKVTGKPEAALTVLERLHALRPGDLDVTAELGLLRGYVAYSSGQPLAGVDLLRSTVAAKPADPRYRLYFARTLDEAYQCTSTNTGAAPKPNRREVCGAAKREYLRAEELASGEDIWSRRIKLRAGKDARRPGLH